MTMTSRSKSPVGPSKTRTPITEELADRVAREAEAGFDLQLSRRVGRRSLTGGPGKSPRVNLPGRCQGRRHALRTSDRAR